MRHRVGRLKEQLRHRNLSSQPPEPAPDSAHRQHGTGLATICEVRRARLHTVAIDHSFKPLEPDTGFAT